MLTSRAAVATTFATGALLLAVVLGASSVPQAPTPAIKKVPYHDIASVDGRANYVAFCAACHGLSGRGNGPAVSALKVAVPDLTQMAARRGGTFDEIAIQRVISGVDKMPAAHGSVDMPMWGQIFNTEGGNTATLRLGNLVKYLRTIQKT